MKLNKWSILLFAVGFMIFLYPVFSNWYYSAYVNKEEVQQLKYKFTNWKDSSQNKSVSSNLLLNEDFASLQKYNEKIYLSTEELSDPFLKTVENKNAEITIDYSSDEVFGIIEIPKIKQELPIYLGASSNHLLKGVGQIQGTSLPIGGTNTNCVLAAHSGLIRQKLFTDLPELEKNDTIIITTRLGTLTYKVTGNKIIMPDETQYLKVVQDEDMITLLTCYDATKENDRLVVFAKRVREQSAVTEIAKKDVSYSSEVMVKPSVDIAGIIFAIFIFIFFLVVFSWLLEKKEGETR